MLQDAVKVSEGSAKQYSISNVLGGLTTTTHNGFETNCAYIEKFE